MGLFKHKGPKRQELIDEQHRERIKRTAQVAAARTERNQERIDRIADILFRGA